MSRRILVVGSISVDHTTFTKVMPLPGVTAKADYFLRSPGGKGANQACAASFLGADVLFCGAIGNDDEGKYLSSFLKKQKVNYQFKHSSKSTGIASITINEETGENQILIVQGANGDISTNDIDHLEPEFAKSDILKCH